MNLLKMINVLQAIKVVTHPNWFEKNLRTKRSKKKMSKCFQTTCYILDKMNKNKLFIIIKKNRSSG